jgi:Flp pilus assembly pilin Flp
MRNRKGQTILEYTVVVIIILGVVIAMKDYIKRGVQGRWKSAADDFGEQYDPQAINSSINYTTLVNSESVVTVINGSYTGPNAAVEQGQWTTRTDSSNSVDAKTGYSQVGD